uniref:GCS light chain n=1 Tax=Cairina moschata TaxID=8855 RepID=A0A8C3CHR8_CAIMO
LYRRGAPALSEPFFIEETGNLLNRGCGHKKCPATPSEEWGDCVQKTLTEWSLKIGQDLNQEIVEVPECTVAQAIEKVNCEDRDELQVSAKLFIIGLNSSSVRDAVDTAFSALGVAQLDSVIIAPPPTEDRNSLSEYLQPSLQELESLVQNKKIVTIHTSDFDKTPLERVYVWAQVKQSSNQVNRAAGCVMPLDLTALAKQVNIQFFQEVLWESIQNIEARVKSRCYIMQDKRHAS